MHKPLPIKIEEKRPKLAGPDIFRVVEENLKKIKEIVLPTLPHSKKLDEFISLYVK